MHAGEELSYPHTALSEPLGVSDGKGCRQLDDQVSAVTQGSGGSGELVAHRDLAALCEAAAHYHHVRLACQTLCLAQKIGVSVVERVEFTYYRGSHTSSCIKKGENSV